MLLVFAVIAMLWLRASGQTVSVTGQVKTYGANQNHATQAVVWLTPIAQTVSDASQAKPIHAVLRQKNKTFEPHILVVTKGSTVDFPNLDPWFHNVFSLFNGKKFDLGLYEAGTSRTVHFDREGISYIFCNIHPEMSAVVVVLSTPYYAQATKSGEFLIAGVPPGRYRLHLWSENSFPDALQGLSREIEVSGITQFAGVFRVPENETAKVQHKNKYGQDYEPPSPSNPVYSQP